MTPAEGVTAAPQSGSASDQLVAKRFGSDELLEAVGSTLRYANGADWTTGSPKTDEPASHHDLAHDGIEGHLVKYSHTPVDGLDVEPDAADAT